MLHLVLVTSYNFSVNWVVKSAQSNNYIGSRNEKLPFLHFDGKALDLRKEQNQKESHHFS